MYYRVKRYEGRLLLLDDDLDTVWPLGRSFIQHGFFVMSCADNSELIPLLTAQPFDFLITEAHLPGIKILEVIRWVCQHNPHTRIVVIAGVCSAQAREAYIREGALFFFEKPIDAVFIADVLVRSFYESPGFSGLVNEIDLFDYIQMVLLSRREVVLEITARDGQQAQIFLSKGNVRHAICGNLEGRQAFFHCLAFKGGTFSTYPWHEPERITINQRGDFLLMDAARFKDEASAGVQGSTDFSGLIEEEHELFLI